jgi:hypothetical protein
MENLTAIAVIETDPSSVLATAFSGKVVYDTKSALRR